MQYRPSSHFNSQHWTTNTGAPVWNNNNSETVGVRGTVSVGRALGGGSISFYVDFLFFFGLEFLR